MACPHGRIYNNYRADMRGRISERQSSKNTSGECLDQRPYSRDLTPPDFDLFPKPKKPLRGIHFLDIDIVNEEVSRDVHELDNQSAAFKRSRNGGNHVLTNRVIISKGCNVAFLLK